MDGASTSGNGALARLRLIIDQLLPHHDIFLLSLLLLLLLSGFLWNISRLRSFLELEFSNLEVTHA
jgi:hypothetical protein